MNLEGAIIVFTVFFIVIACMIGIAVYGIKDALERIASSLDQDIRSKALSERPPRPS